MFPGNNAFSGPVAAKLAAAQQIPGLSQKYTA